MTTIKRSALVLYSTEEMYALVNDIEAYPQFVPGCRDSDVSFRQEDSLEGHLKVEKGPFSYTIKTCNQMVKNEKITMSLSEGQFRHLSGEWQFIALNDSACKVVFRLDFELIHLTDIALAGILQIASNQVLQAFCKQAEKRYGKREMSLLT